MLTNELSSHGKLIHAPPCRNVNMNPDSIKAVEHKVDLPISRAWISNYIAHYSVGCNYLSMP